MVSTALDAHENERCWDEPLSFRKRIRVSLASRRHIPVPAVTPCLRVRCYYVALTVWLNHDEYTHVYVLLSSCFFN